MICNSVHMTVLPLLLILAWQVFLCTSTSISPIITTLGESSDERSTNTNNEGLVLDQQNKSENTSIVVGHLMSHEELVTEIFKMRKELKSQNERLNLQEKKILMLESSSNNDKVDKGKANKSNNNSSPLLKTTKTAHLDKKLHRANKRDTDLHEQPDAAIPNKDIFSGEPSSCHDLHLIGHYLNGYYLIKSNNGNIGPVFCNFNEPIEGEEYTTENSSADAGVHFFVQRNRPWSTEGAIPFQIEKLNIGGAIDVSTGIFTAPQDGVYRFAFSGMMKSGMGRLYVLLRRNMNETIAVAHGFVGANSIISPMISFTATVSLKKDDRIDLYKTNDNGVLYDSFYYSYTSYTGSLLTD